MDIYRVGVIADTHVPEALPALPGEIAGLFQGVDLILHAGDINSKEVLDGRPFWWGGFQGQILRAFQDVDVIIFGHFHRPYVAWYQNVLLFNPGAVYQLTPEQAKAELGRTFQPLSLIYLLNALRRRPVAPSVGLLTIEDGTIKADIFPLTL